MPTRLKEKSYNTIIRLVMTHETEYWPIKKQHIHKIDIVEIKMLRWMYGKSRKNKIRNEYF